MLNKILYLLVALFMGLTAAAQENNEASQLLDRVADFIGHFETVGQKLQDASSSFTKAADKLKDGRLSVVGAANKLIKLGAKASAKKVIPEENEPWHGVEGTAETGANLPG